MSDNNKFEQLIELFIAEDEQGAKDLFHEIVVEKSRDIYESLVDEEQVEETAEVEEDAEAVEESEDEAVEESEEEAVEESEVDEAEIGGDASDDMIDDIEADEQGLSMEADADDEEIEDRVVDIENALEELKAEFDALMGGDDAEGGDEEMDMDMDMDAGDEEGDEEEEEMESVEPVEEETEEMVREYTEKAPAPVTTEQGDGSEGPVAGKNDMGGSAKNIAQGGEEKGGATPKSTVQTDAANPKGATMSKA
jgi:hypothetical protein